MKNEIMVKENGFTEICGIKVKVLEGGFGDGKRFLTAHQIAEIHGTPVGEVNRLIIDNDDEFEEGVDILNLLSMGSTHSEINNMFELNIPNNTKNFYILSEQGYMALVSLMRTDKAKQIRKQVRREYFTMREIIQSDEQLMAKLTFTIYNGGQDGILAAKKLTEIEVAKATKPLLETIEVQQPKVDFAERLLKTKDNILVREFAKVLCDEGFSVGEKKLYKWLRENKFVMHNNEPYQKYVDNNTFVVKVGTISTAFGDKQTRTTKITPSGQLYIFNKIKESGEFNK